VAEEREKRWARRPRRPPEGLDSCDVLGLGPTPRSGVEAPARASNAPSPPALALPTAKPGEEREKWELWEGQGAAEDESEEDLGCMRALVVVTMVVEVGLVFMRTETPPALTRDVRDMLVLGRVLPAPQLEWKVPPVPVARGDGPHSAAGGSVVGIGSWATPRLQSFSNLVRKAGSTSHNSCTLHGTRQARENCTQTSSSRVNWCRAAVLV